MAQILLSDCVITLGTITLGTNAIKSAKLNDLTPSIDNTGMGMGAKSRRVGFPDWSLELEVFADYADDALDEDLFTIRAADGDVGAVSIKPTSAAISAANPAYTATAGFLDTYTIIGADEVGKHGTVAIKILAMGAALIRDIVA